MADIFLNESHIDQHISAFRPFVLDVKDYLKDPGEENFLVVRLTTGVESVSEADLSPIEPYISLSSAMVGERGDKRRVFVRKPQYTWGWDWSPRVPTCGITGDAIIRPLKEGVLRDVYVTTELWDGSARLDVTVELESLDWIGTQDGSVVVVMTDEDGNEFSVTDDDVLLRSGTNKIDLEIDIDDPRLWWPNGMGDQHLYQVDVTVQVGGQELTYPAFDYGVRTVELDQQRLNDEERLFAVRVNGERVYCRGANWLMPDSIYARATPEDYETLVEEAREANFTMFRVNGVSVYEDDCFYECCDEAGILLLQDFTFACSAYPDHEDWFVEEIEKEVDYQTTRLRNHPSIAIWGGNNENMWGLNDWWDRETRGGATLYNEVIPEIVSKNSPDVPYWNGSPYGGTTPNSPKIGTRHHWHDCMMNEDMETRTSPEAYDEADPKFVAEFGYIGPCCEETTSRYLGEHPIDRDSDVWKHHTNPFEKDTVVAGIKRHYGVSEPMTDDEYLLYGGLVHGLMLGYALDSFRSRENCSGGLFWMFNDCRGEVGWAIIDYYLNRKIAYHFVRRANEPVRLIIRERDDEIDVILANDSGTAVVDSIEVGYRSFDGKRQDLEMASVEVPPFSREVVATCSRDGHDLSSGCLSAKLTDNEQVRPGIFWATEFQNLDLAPAGLEISGFESDGNWATFTVTADQFAHSVHFDLPMDCRLSDEYFDLLPGELRTIEVTGDGVTEDMLQPQSISKKKAVFDAGDRE